MKNTWQQQANEAPWQLLSLLASAKIPLRFFLPIVMLVQVSFIFHLQFYHLKKQSIRKKSGIFKWKNFARSWVFLIKFYGLL